MKIKLTYTGKRRNHAGKLYHAFVDDKGEQHCFGGSFRMVFIGYQYEAEKKKDGMSISVRPEEKGRIDDDEKVDQWRAQERVAEQEARKERVRKKAQSMKGLLEEIPKIKHAMRGLKGSEQREFIDWLWYEIDRENREKLNREMNVLFQKRLKRAKKSGR